MRTHSVTLSAGTITLREWGKGDGLPLLYWHGLNPFGALELNEAGPAWAADGFRVVAFAAPGIGDSHALDDLAGYRPAALGDLVVETADALQLERFVFVGWSWGASLGVHLGVRHAGRLRALVLLDAGHTDIPGDQGRTLGEILAELGDRQERYRFETWQDFFADARQSRPKWRPALEQRLRAGMRESERGIVARADRRAAAAAWYGLLQQQPSSTHAELGRIEVPILLVVASGNDTADELDRFRRLVPRADARELESGHDVLADAPDETIALVSEWVRSAIGGPH
jgi:pimeloyl-ACP methyl ester carboxylesterase